MKRLLPLLLAMTATASAQQSSAPVAAPSGQVAGIIRCHDTGRPCRFAGVVLLPQKGATAPPLDLGTLGAGTDASKTMAAAMAVVTKMLKHDSDLAAVTDLEGRFAIAKVPPGTYYVIAQLAGYVSPISGLARNEIARPDDRTLAAVQSRAKRIVVQAGQTATIAVELDRGATLSGTVAYSDGTAAAAVQPHLLVRAQDGAWKEVSPLGTERTVTGNHGEFEFSGLPPGDYAVKAGLPTSQALSGLGSALMSLHIDLGDELTVYSDGAVRQSDIKPVHLGAEGNRSVKIVFPLEGLHAISGRVIAQSDHHAVNAGTIELQDPATKVAVRSALIGTDGTFQMRYVPGGEYLLKVTSAADTQSDAGDLPCPIRCKEIRSYLSMALPLTLTGDAAGLELPVADATK